MNHLAEAHAALTRALASDRTSVELLPEDQVLISKDLIAAGENAAQKTPRRVPGPAGYTIYIKYASAGAAQGPQQRWTGPLDRVQRDSAVDALRLDRQSLDQSWELPARGNARIAITARCGSAAVFDEVDGVLALIAKVLP